MDGVSGRQGAQLLLFVKRGATLPRVPAPRRLPVLGGADPRPAWQRAALGALFTFVSWVPLAALGRIVSRHYVARTFAGLAAAEVSARVAASAARDRAVLWLVASGLPLASVALACAVGGFLLARLGQGDVSAGRRGGALFGGLAWLLAVLAAGIGRSATERAMSALALAVLVGVGWALGGTGAALGSRGKS
jgi:hypothetical protein